MSGPHLYKAASVAHHLFITFNKEQCWKCVCIVSIPMRPQKKKEKEKKPWLTARFTGVLVAAKATPSLSGRKRLEAEFSTGFILEEGPLQMSTQYCSQLKNTCNSYFGFSQVKILGLLFTSWVRSTTLPASFCAPLQAFKQFAISFCWRLWGSIFIYFNVMWGRFDWSPLYSLKKFERWKKCSFECRCIKICPF